MLLVCLICFSLSSYAEKELQESEIAIQWEGDTLGDQIYIATIRGIVHAVNIFNGSIVWSVDTGGDLFRSVTTNAVTLLPTIDGHIISYKKNYGFQKLPSSFNEMLTLSPFSNGEGIYICNKLSSYYSIADNGSIEFTFPDQTPLLDISNHGKNQITRTNYDLIVYDNNYESIQYSFFTVFDFELDEEESPIMSKIQVNTSLNGHVSLLVNKSITWELDFDDIPMSVNNETGQLRFSTYNDGVRIPKYNLLLWNLNMSRVVIPSVSIVSGTEFKVIIDNLPDPFNHSVLIVTPSQIPTNEDNDKYILIIIGIIVLASSIILITSYFYWKITNATRIDIQNSKFDDKKCTILKIPNEKRELFMALASIDAIDFKHSENEYFALGEQIPFDFASYSPLEFLHNVIFIIEKLWKNNPPIAHGSIGLDTFGMGANGPIIFGFEKEAHFTDNPKDLEKDIFDLGTLIRVKYKITDLLFNDLLNDMTNSVSSERPTPTEILRHPIFLTGVQKMSIIVRANDLFQADKNPRNRDSNRLRRCGALNDFESNRITIIGPNWISSLDESLTEEALSHAEYDSDSLIDFVRFVRNKYEHPPEGSAIISKDPDMCFNYFHQTFPKFFLYLYYFVDRYNSEYF